MLELTHDEEFIDEFLKAVLLEVRDSQDYSLFSKRYRVRLNLTSEEEERLKELASKCHEEGKKPSHNFIEWFVLAFTAGIAQNCRKVEGNILVRTPAGYEKWEDLVNIYPIELLRQKIEERRLAFEKAKNVDASLASHLLESPIIWHKLPMETGGDKNIEGVIKSEKLLKYLCPALRSVSDDAFEIAKVITPILLSLAIVGTISLPLAPTLFASIAIFISKMGIAAFCVDYPSTKDSEK